jgi:hypothetical protein
MTFPELVAFLETKAEAAEAAWAAFNQAHPEVAGVEADALSVGVTDLAKAARSAAAAAPPVARPTIDELIAAVEAKADADIADIKSSAEGQVAALRKAQAIAPAIAAG